MIKYFCDCCEAEIEAGSSKLDVHIDVSDQKNEYSQNNTVVTRMVCIRCVTKLRNSLKELKFLV